MSETVRDDGAQPSQSIAVNVSSLKAFANQVDGFPPIFNPSEKLAEPPERVGRAAVFGAAVVLGDRNVECLGLTEGLVEAADKRWKLMAKAVRDLADGYASDDSYSAATVKQVHAEFAGDPETNNG